MAVALGVIQGRAMYESAHYFALAEASLIAGDRPSAVLHFRHSAQWYTPIGSRTRAALQRTMLLGDEAFATHDLESALYAWRSARGAILSTRHLFTPNADMLPGLHERIGHAMFLQGESLTSAASGSAQRSAAEYTAELAAWRERQPSTPRALGASLAFVGWLGSLLLFARHGLTPDGRLVKAKVPILFVSLVLLFFWVVLVRIA